MIARQTSDLVIRRIKRRFLGRGDPSGADLIGRAGCLEYWLLRSREPDADPLLQAQVGGERLVLFASEVEFRPAWFERMPEMREAR